MFKRYMAIFLVSFLFAKPASAEVIVVDVNGLVCEFCAVTIEKNFKKKPQIVQSVKVDLESKKVTIALQEGKKLSDQEVKEIIVNNGYNVMQINRKP